MKKKSDKKREKINSERRRGMHAPQEKIFREGAS